MLNGHDVPALLGVERSMPSVTCAYGKPKTKSEFKQQFFKYNFWGRQGSTPIN